MDPASWRIVLGELEAGWHALNSGRAPGAGAGAHVAAAVVTDCSAERALKLDTCDFWEAQLDGDDPAARHPPGLPADRPGRRRGGRHVVHRPRGDRRAAQRRRPVPELLAAAAARTVTAWRRAPRAGPTPAPLLALETHGRADAVVSAGLADDARLIDTGDTVGSAQRDLPAAVRLADGGRARRRSPATASTTGCCATCAPTPPSDSVRTAIRRCC